jgi:AcrR family transcriptional regulator
MPYRTSVQTAARKAALHNRILDAARELFVSRGYSATSMQDIVKAAGTSIGNCYFYFPDKAALLLALAEEANRVISEHVDQAIAAAGDDPVAQLAVAVASGAQALLTQRDLAHVLVIEAHHPEVRARMLAHFIARVTQVFAAAPALAGGTAPALLAHAWQGAIATVLEGVLRGTISGTPAEVGQFLARWNLQALGLPAERVQQTLADLAEHDVGVRLVAPSSVDASSDPAAG